MASLVERFRQLMNSPPDPGRRRLLKGLVVWGILFGATGCLPKTKLFPRETCLENPLVTIPLDGSVQLVPVAVTKDIKTLDMKLTLVNIGYVPHCFEYQIGVSLETDGKITTGTEFPSPVTGIFQLSNASDFVGCYINGDALQIGLRPDTANRWKLAPPEPVSAPTSPAP